MGEMRGWGMMIRRKKCSRENVRMTYLKVINSSGKKTILKCMAILFFKVSVYGRFFTVLTALFERQAPKSTDHLGSYTIF